ncbi:MAG: DUF2330 domain-containing protein [Burkholderiales bacterium]
MNALIRPGFARSLAAAALTLSCTLNAPSALAFCGFYVGKADANLFNEASQVVMVRDGDRTTITMRNDYQGDLQEFAMVVPVPEVLPEESIKVVDNVLFDRIDAYSAPRLAEYYDANPCHPLRERKNGLIGRAPQALAMDAAKSKVEEDRGVTVEAEYTIGEYDVVILSAKESNGLETWLRENGYRIPAGAAHALAPYIRQDLKFFVAKVNLAEQAKTGSAYLRPMQFSFRTGKFMLPIRLGMLNAHGPQDLVLWVLTRTGRVESTNYRTVHLPANMDIPTYVKGDFRTFYKALFDTQAKRAEYRVLFTEYVWNMSWCDPCAANPLTPAELRGLGVEWVTSGGGRAPRAQPVMLTRLHVRYTDATFPEDLVFQETKDRTNYQARYVLRHPAKVAPDACPAAGPYLDGVVARQEREAKVLATLTGWDVDAIRDRMNIAPLQAWWEEWWVGVAP